MRNGIKFAEELSHSDGFGIDGPVKNLGVVGVALLKETGHHLGQSVENFSFATQRHAN